MFRKKGVKRGKQKEPFNHFRKKGSEKTGKDYFFCYFFFKWGEVKGKYKQKYQQLRKV